MENTLQELQGRIAGALQIAFGDAWVDGEHHKMWVINQMVRELTGDGYEAWVEEYQTPNEDGEWSEWDCGIAP